MPNIGTIPVVDTCVGCDSGNFYWTLEVSIDSEHVVAKCKKCLSTFVTTRTAFLKRSQKQVPREAGQEG